MQKYVPPLPKVSVYVNGVRLAPTGALCVSFAGCALTALIGHGL
jgi:hypothetical protein